jgi:hypothetical protein
MKDYTFIDLDFSSITNLKDFNCLTNNSTSLTDHLFYTGIFKHTFSYFIDIYSGYFFNFLKVFRVPFKNAFEDTTANKAYCDIFAEGVSVIPFSFEELKALILNLKPNNESILGSSLYAQVVLLRDLSWDKFFTVSFNNLFISQDFSSATFLAFINHSFSEKISLLDFLIMHVIFDRQFILPIYNEKDEPLFFVEKGQTTTFFKKKILLNKQEDNLSSTAYFFDNPYFNTYQTPFFKFLNYINKLEVSRMNSDTLFRLNTLQSVTQVLETKLHQASNSVKITEFSNPHTWI